jgi:hypothetical protein
MISIHRRLTTGGSFFAPQLHACSHPSYASEQACLENQAVKQVWAGILKHGASAG